MVSDPTHAQRRASAAIGAAFAVALETGYQAESIWLGLLLYRAAPELWAEWVRNWPHSDAVDVVRLQQVADSICASVRDIAAAVVPDAR